MDAYYLTTLSHNLANDRPVVAPLECAWSPIVLDRRGQHPRAIDFRIDNIVVDLFAPALAIQKDYSNTFTLLRVQSTYAISLLYTRRADLETIIPILRSPMASPDSLLTQYCWLDFNKAWETVHTDARQARYRDRYRLNTAATLWRASGLTYFHISFQNLFAVGVVDSMAVVNLFEMAQRLTLK
ncbi:hypothetical protein H257_09710 [Aphanomyces astaci]|uniref:Uncharacterized protein n=1 Tax=Aphanomyces astaci TaxID=112090 RepID=W4G932_APHAT|nr:hypothetical protein H257_09710 [Aphanomyces astaci]ETV76202.1 hypothetical protein H257_09710 [Aphanomyces astaci]|eukprot:XP_009834327.1 hypothetical protein H257_09710 [Aphanomyces astaci]